MRKNKVRLNGRHKKRCFVFSVGLMIISMGYATTFTDDLAQVKSFQGSGLSQQKNFNPNQQLPHYQSQPAVSHYYKGVTSDNVDLTAQADVARTTNPAMHAVYQDTLNRHRDTISLKDPIVTQSDFIQQHADPIARGVNDQYVDCKKQKACHIVYHSAACQRGQHYQQVCTLNRVVHSEDHISDDPRIITGRIPREGHQFTGTIYLPSDAAQLRTFHVHIHNFGPNWYRGVRYTSYLNGRTISSTVGSSPL